MTSTWSSRRLRDVAAKIGSGSTPRGGAAVYADHGIPFIRSQNVRGGLLDLSDAVCLTAQQHAEMRGTHVRAGDVLLNITGASIGRSCVVPSGITEANVSQHVCIIRCDVRLVDAHFLQAWFASERTQAHMRKLAAGGSREGLNHQQLGGLVVPLPPLRVQIAASSIFLRITEEEQRIAALMQLKHRLKRALLQQLLSGELRYSASKRANWQVLSLGDIVRIRSGNTPSKARADFWEGTFPWISAKDLKTARISDSIDRISATAVASGAAVVPPGTVVVLVRGMMLLKDVPVGLTTRDVAINQDIKGLEPATQVYPEFLLYALIAKRGQLMGFVSRAGHGTGKLDTDRLLGLPLRLPPMAEQLRIAAVLATLDRELNLLDRQLTTLRKLKRGLMQKLLTGELEVPVDTRKEREEARS